MSEEFHSEVWGPHFWFFITTIAMIYPDHPNSIIQEKYYRFFQNLPIFIPNGEIATRVAELLDEIPIQPYLRCRKDLLYWCWRIHNKINQQLGKPELSLPFAMENYHNHYKSKTARWVEKVQSTKQWMFGFFILSSAMIVLYFF